MNIFTNLIEAAGEAADLLVEAPIGSVQYEAGIKLLVARQPFLEKEAVSESVPQGQNYLEPADQTP